MSQTQPDSFPNVTGMASSSFLHRFLLIFSEPMQAQVFLSAFCKHLNFTTATSMAYWAVFKSCGTSLDKESFLHIFYKSAPKPYRHGQAYKRKNANLWDSFSVLLPLWLNLLQTQLNVGHIYFGSVLEDFLCHGGVDMASGELYSVEVPGKPWLGYILTNQGEESETKEHITLKVDAQQFSLPRFFISKNPTTANRVLPGGGSVFKHLSPWRSLQS